MDEQKIKTVGDFARLTAVEVEKIAGGVELIKRKLGRLVRVPGGGPVNQSDSWTTTVTSQERIIKPRDMRAVLRASMTSAGEFKILL